MFTTKQFLVPLPESPCCIDFVSTRTVIVGTYELDETSGNGRRNGSLCLIRDKQLIHRKVCPDGGVFNLQLVFPSQETECNSHAFVIVAHANGCLTLYKVSTESPEITAVVRHETGSSLLSSVNVIPAGESSHWICAGASDGKIHLLKLHDYSRFKSVASHDENDSQQPVWCVQTFIFKDHLIIVSGSDDCSWRIFLLGKGSETPELIYKNSDAHSGVTSIHLQLEVTPERIAGIILIGSYDERIRSYRITVDSDLLPLVVRKKIKHIPGSGIWRIRAVNHQESPKLLIAGMYSGIHMCDSDMSEELVSKDWPSARTETSEGRQLIYDVLLLSNGNIVVASFSEKSVYILTDE